MALPPGTSLAGYSAEPRRRFDDPPGAILLTLGALLGSCVDPTPGTAAALFQPGQGTRDPVGAKALVLENGTRTVALVKLDTVGTPKRLRSELVAAAQGLGIAPEDFVVVATHTHSGPGGLSDDPFAQVAAADCFSASVHAAALAAARQALLAAHAALQPAVLGIGVATETGASEGRDGDLTHFDPELGVVKVATLAGAPIAALFNFAIHGTSLDANNMRFSADNMGAMEDRIEAGLPGVVAIFTNGAEGDVAPKFRDDAGVAQEGQIVGDAVLALWPGIATQGSIVLDGALRQVTMPFPTFNTAAGIPGVPLQIPLSPTWVPTRLPFQALRIGDVVFAAVPGEPTTDIGKEIKQRALALGFARGFVLGLSNEYGGYFTTPSGYTNGGIAARSTIYGPGAGELVVERAEDVMAAVK
jgi:hypothetical protein